MVSFKVPLVAIVALAGAVTGRPSLNERRSAQADIPSRCDTTTGCPDGGYCYYAPSGDYGVCVGGGAKRQVSACGEDMSCPEGKVCYTNPSGLGGVCITAT